MAASSADVEVLNFRYQERMFVLLSAFHERRTLLRVAAVTFFVLGCIAAGFLRHTAPLYALAAAVPVAICVACDVAYGLRMRRLRAGVPEMRPPHLDYRPLAPAGDELHLYPLLLASGIAAGAAVLYVGLGL